MNEIVAISIVNIECNLEDGKKKEKVENYNVVRKYDKKVLPYDLDRNKNINIIKMEDETSLLNYMLSKIL